MPRVSARDDEALLEEGARREAHLRVPAIFPGGLFHLHRASVSTRRKPIARRDLFKDKQEVCVACTCQFFKRLFIFSCSLMVQQKVAVGFFF